MPIYDYQCQQCDHTFEHMHSIHDKPIKKCPKCKKLKVKRLISVGAGVILKGSGFYSVDHGKKSTHVASDVQNTDASSTKKTTESHNVKDKKKEDVS